MASAIIVYYSISGTTRRVAEQIAAGLLAGGFECALHDLRARGAPDLSGYAVVGIGTPVHYYRLPPPVDEALGGLGRLDGVSSFSFVLHSTYRGTALNSVRRALAQAGSTEIGAYSSFGEGLFLGYLREGYLFSAAHPDTCDLDRAREFGSSLALAHRAVVRGDEPPPMPRPDSELGPVYRLERALTRPAIGRAVYSRFFSADRRLCTRCGRCARECPTGNITAARGEFPVWGRDCTICTTCAVVCPQGAVGCPVGWVAFKPFLRYNARQAAADPAIDKIRIHFDRGRIDGKPIRLPGYSAVDSRVGEGRASEPPC